MGQKLPLAVSTNKVPEMMTSSTETPTTPYEGTIAGPNKTSQFGTLVKLRDQRLIWHPLKTCKLFDILIPRYTDT